MRDFIKDVIIPTLLLIGLLSLIVGVIMGVGTLMCIPDVNIFNQQYSTHYTAWQWFCASDTIKDYVGIGEVERKNIQLEITNK